MQPGFDLNTGRRNSLPLARELLTGSRSAFVRISDENVHLVRCFSGSWLGFFGQESRIVSRLTFTLLLAND